MSTRDELYPSKWFKASDIPEMGLPVQIELVTRKKIGAELKDKPVVGFKGHEKELVLNVTNFDCIADALGEDDTDKWRGRVVELYATETSFGGKVTPCVRVRKHKRPPPPVKRPPSTELDPPPHNSADIPFNDEIDNI